MPDDKKPKPKPKSLIERALEALSLLPSGIERIGVHRGPATLEPIGINRGGTPKPQPIRTAPTTLKKIRRNALIDRMERDE